MSRITLTSVAVSATLLLAACGQAEPEQGPPPPPEVGFVVLSTSSTAIRTELAGRTAAYATSEVRPQVSGIVRSRPFTEGAYVRAGQTLYQIDDAPYRAALQQAQAAVASAEASVFSTRAQSQRFAELVKINAVSRQEADDAEAAFRQATAAVAQARAQVRTASINLGYTRVTAPISGRIGRSTITQGALVTASQAEPLATIQRLDPMYVDVTQSSADLLRLRRQLSSGGVAPTSAAVTLTLPDGTEYGPGGTLQFTEPTVDEATGTVTLRAVFPNPSGLLLPGMYVRARVTEAIDPNAILAPQQGISRNPRGQATAIVVGANNRAEERIVTTGQAIGDRWQVTGGLKAGDRLIVEGLQRVQVGQPVRPVPAGAARPAAAAPAQPAPAAAR